MNSPGSIGAIDCMIGFPEADFAVYDFIRAQLKDSESTEHDFPVEYMFKDVPKDLYGADDDPVAITLAAMDRNGVARGLIGCEGDLAHRALTDHPDRFIPGANVDPNDVVGAVAKIQRQHRDFGIRSVGLFPAGCTPQVAIDDPKCYAVYATCCELAIPIFVCAGVPGPRLPMASQHVEQIDRVMYDFPELIFVIRHGCEPWAELAVKLMIKWPGLHYATSAFAPKYYPRAIVDYANTRGADKILYAGYFPMGLTLDRIFSEMGSVPLKKDVWPKFLRDNAARVLNLE